jgi:hypothetical protein
MICTLNFWILRTRTTHFDIGGGAERRGSANIIIIADIFSLETIVSTDIFSVYPRETPLYILL